MQSWCYRMDSSAHALGGCAALDGSVCALDCCAVQENQGAELQALYPRFSGLCREAQPCSCEPGKLGADCGRGALGYVTIHWSPSILEPHFVSILNKGSQTTSTAFRLCFGNEIIFTKDQNLGTRSRLKRSGGHHLWQPSLCQDLGGFHPTELVPRPDPRTGSPNLQRALAPGLDQGLWGTSVPLLCGGPDLGLQGASVPLLCGGLDTGPQGASVPLLCEGRRWGRDTGLAPLDACLLFQLRGVTLALLTGGVVIVWGQVRHGG